MEWLHLSSLVVIAFTWLFAWRRGCRWCLACGVDERTSRLALGSILPTVGLIVAVHLPALASLITGRGLVTPEPVALIFLALTWLLYQTRFGARSTATSEAKSQTASPNTRGQAFGSATSLASMFDRWREPGVVARRGSWDRRLAYLPMAIIVGMYAVFLVDALTRYPTGYDARNYHLPQAIAWMQERCLNLLDGFLLRAPPENGMLVLFLLAFAKLERLFTVVHLVKGLLLGAVMYGLSRAVGVSSLGARLSACVALSVPIVVFQSFSGYVDLYAVASYLAALLALTWAVRAKLKGQRRGLLVLAGLSAGVALGSKSTFLVWVPLLALAAMAVEWIRPRTEPGDRAKPMQTLALFGVGALACSGFWFLRGTVQAGNPIYPLAVRVGETTLLPGISVDGFFPERTMAKKFTRWWDYPWRETKFSGTGYPYSVNNGLGAAYAMFVPLGVLASLVSLVSHRPRAPAQKWRAVYLLLALSGFVFLFTVFHEVLRFVLPPALVAVPLAAVLMDRLLVKFPRSLLVGVTVSLAVTAAIATLRPAHSLAGRVRDNAWDRATFYRIPPLIDELEPQTRIVNLARTLWNYPLQGSRLSNVFIDQAVWKFLLLAGEPISTEALHRHGIDYLYVRGAPPAHWSEDLAVEVVYDDSRKPRPSGVPPTYVYRVLPADEPPLGLLADRTASP